jgi:hypothetical protein
MRNLSILIGSFSFILQFQIVHAQELQYSKLELRKNQVYTIHNQDTSGTLAVDTLIMNDHSKIFLFGKTEFNIIARYAIIGNNCIIIGHDAKNNGTDLNIQMGLVSLGKLKILVEGVNRMEGFRDFPNGDGGDVHFYYSDHGQTPQTDRPRQNRYLFISNSGAQGSNQPEVDLDIIKSEIQMGQSNPARPLTALRQGTVFDVRSGKNGITEIKVLDF